jgi:hypothetical protein
VHLGCPPRFSGLYLSRFTFSSLPLGKTASWARASPCRFSGAFRHTPCLRRALLAISGGDGLFGLFWSVTWCLQNTV